MNIDKFLPILILINFIVFILLVSHAHAGPFIGAQYQYQDAITNNDALVINAGYKMENGWTPSVQIKNSQANLGDGDISVGMEGRLKKSFKVGAFSPYVQGRLGESVSTNKEYGYYAIDSGIKAPIPYLNDTSLDIVYRFKDAFDGKLAKEEHRYGIQVDYKITGNHGLGVQYRQAFAGDLPSKSYALKYTYNF